MSDGASLAARVPALGGVLAGAHSPETRWRIAVYGASTLACVIWSFFAGRDLNWDALNYHLYAGYSAINGRFDKDFLAAGSQAYFNPYAHVPLYVMVKLNLPSLTMGTIFACLHSVNLWLTYELAGSVSRAEGIVRWQGIAVVAVLFAFLNPVFLQLTGSTYVDNTTGALALGGWLALATTFEKPTAWRVLLAGGLLGVATALKLSNAVFAVAAMIVIMFASPPFVQRLRMVASFGATCAVAFAVVDGAWAWQLWREFHNPVFPFFNGIFGSPEFTTEPVKHLRFVPDSFAAALWRPVEMTFPLPMVHVEPQAPDARYVELAVVAAGALLVSAFAWLRQVADSSETTITRVVPRRALAGVAAGFVVAWAVWLYMSGNSRYFIPMGCVAAVLIAVLLHRFARGKRTAFAVIAALLLLPQFYLVTASTWTRWNAMDWKGPWYEVVIPERFVREPYLYLSIGTQAATFLAPFLAEGSAMMAISGPQVVTPDSPGGARALALIRRNAPRLRMVDWVGQFRSDGTPLPQSADQYYGRLRPFGLRVDPNDCTYFKLRGGMPPKIVQSSGAVLSERPPSHFLSCGLVPSGEKIEDYLLERDKVDRIFDRVEDRCPNLFQPRRMATEQYLGFWRRVYMNTDILLWIGGGQVKYRVSVPGADAIDLGNAADWTGEVDCSKRAYTGKAEAPASRMSATP